ncbi:MAG: aminotransferase class V-fold PLP-dependent enzyme [Marmoricola sp.]
MKNAHPYADFTGPLTRAHQISLDWLDSLDTRAVTPSTDVETTLAKLGDLPEHPGDPTQTIEHLAAVVEPGLAAYGSGRWFGFVAGGSLPAALAADWLVSTWDQNAALRAVSPGPIAAEICAGRWLLDLFDLPRDSAVGFTTGATTANFSALAAARGHLLKRAGWDDELGIAGGPSIRVLAGAEVHISPINGLHYLGLPNAERLDVDDQGRLLPSALRAALEEQPDRPTILLLQAGNIHSGASDPFAELIPIAHEFGAWVHVDGAFGLWQAVSPRYRPLCDGVADADSWATDAHKTLNVPYDGGIVVVRDAGDLRFAMSMHAAYLIEDEVGDPHEFVPELSRRARGVPIWAALHSLGRSGVVDLVERLCLRAAQLAEGVAEIPGATVVNEVCFTQVCVTFGSDERTDAIVARMLADGVAWMSGSKWRGQSVLRISVSNWQTDEDDVRRSLEAIAAAVRSA